MTPKSSVAAPHERLTVVVPAVPSSGSGAVGADWSSGFGVAVGAGVASARGSGVGAGLALGSGVGDGIGVGDGDGLGFGSGGMVTPFVTAFPTLPDVSTAATPYV